MKRAIGLGLLLLLACAGAYAIGTRTETAVRVDAGTGCAWLVDVDTQGVHEWLTPTGQAAFIMDDQGNRAGVAECGALKVVQSSGLPQTGIDAAANTDDTYYDVMTTSRRCHYVSVYVATKGVQLSFDGGATNGPALEAGSQVFAGLDIPAGSVISARNAEVTADYTALIVSVW